MNFSLSVHEACSFLSKLCCFFFFFLTDSTGLLNNNNNNIYYYTSNLWLVWRHERSVCMSETGSKWLALIGCRKYYDQFLVLLLFIWSYLLLFLLSTTCCRYQNCCSWKKDKNCKAEKLAGCHRIFSIILFLVKLYNEHYAFYIHFHCCLFLSNAGYITCILEMYKFQ